MPRYNKRTSSTRGDSVFEIGCGSGANLYMFLQEGMVIGGLDYSEKLVTIMRKVFAKAELRECICEEAVNCPTDIRYDAVLSNSVFSYFPDYVYAKKTLERMFRKCRRSIGIIDVHDELKRQAFKEYRIQNTMNYKERYKNLPKLFYTKSFFEDFAQEHKLSICFKESRVEGYWNNPFVFNCFMYRKL